MNAFNLVCTLCFIAGFVCKRWTLSAWERSVFQSKWQRELCLRTHRCWSWSVSARAQWSWSGEMARMSTCYVTSSRCDVMTTEGMLDSSLCHFYDCHIAQNIFGEDIQHPLSYYYLSVSTAEWFCNLPYQKYNTLNYCWTMVFWVWFNHVVNYGKKVRSANHGWPWLNMGYRMLNFGMIQPYGQSWLTEPFTIVNHMVEPYQKNHGSTMVDRTFLP